MSRRKKPAPADVLDDVLTGSAELERSASERKKYALRKAHEEARREREMATKRTGRPTVEDLCADLVRVAEHDLNPFHKHRHVSGPRYRELGYYPIEYLHREFGTFAHSCQVAGLREDVGTRLQNSARAARSVQEHAERYATKYVLPHCNKFPDLARRATRWELVATISDLHATYLDPFTWSIFLQVIADLEPGTVVFNGDVLDAVALSTFPKIPGHTVDLQVEFDFARELFRQVREVLPSARIVYTAGNHGVQRLARYLTTVARDLAPLRNLRFDALLGLGEYDVQLYQGGFCSSPLGTELDEPRAKLFEAYLVTHGTSLGQHPAAAELRRWGCSGTSGHVHRAGVAFGASKESRKLSWMTTPCACTDEAAWSYVRDFAPWNRGFGLAWIKDGKVRQYPVTVDDGEAIVEGHAYEARVVERTDPSVLWVQGFEREVFGR